MLTKGSLKQQGIFTSLTDLKMQGEWPNSAKVYSLQQYMRQAAMKMRAFRRKTNPSQQNKHKPHQALDAQQVLVAMDGAIEAQAYACAMQIGLGQHAIHTARVSLRVVGKIMESAEHPAPMNQEGAIVWALIVDPVAT